MPDRRLHCLNLKLSMCFRVRSRSPVKKALCNNSQQLPAVRCCIGLLLKSATRSTKILKIIWKHLIKWKLGKMWKTHSPRSPKNGFPKAFHIRFSFLHLISNGLISASRWWLCYKFLCSIFSKNTQPLDFIKRILIWKLT